MKRRSFLGGLLGVISLPILAKTKVAELVEEKITSFDVAINDDWQVVRYTGNGENQIVLTGHDTNSKVPFVMVKNLDGGNWVVHK